MKKTNKGDCPASLAHYVDAYPDDSWEAFRTAHRGQLYKELKQAALLDQGGLCAYCETKCQDRPDLFSIEHFQPKSESTQGGKNIALDWQNLLAVCRGGRDTHHIDKGLYPTPANLSCDAYKDHVDNTPACLNPLHITPNKLFQFNKATHDLEPNDGLDPTLAQQVKDTITVLNLNCQRLRDARYQILIQYNQLLTQARQMKNHRIKQELAQRWFSTPWPSFFTTRRCLLGKAAEDFLNNQKYHFDVCFSDYKDRRHT